MEAIVFLGFGLHAWITIVTVLTMLTVLLFTKRIMGSTDHFLKFLYYTSFLTPHDSTSKFST